MIYQEIIRDKKIYKFTFTGRHIYCYIHAISETSNDLNIINKIIINYSNKEEIEEYKKQLINHKKYNEIILAIDNMMTGKQVVYVAENTLDTRKLAWYNNLYLDQGSSNIMPPIVVPDLEPKTLNFEQSLY
jgi:hypothetical protein